MAKADDNRILKAFKDPRTRNFAFSQLVNKYQERLYWHVRRMVIDHDDADDVLQNTFIKAFTNLSGFRAESQLYTWLFRIATNESISFLRKKRKHLFVSLDDVSHVLAGKLDDSTCLSGDAIQAKLQHAILTLPNKQRIVFNLRYFEEMKYRDMSETLGTSVGALKASYHHAVKKIEAYMKKQF